MRKKLDSRFPAARIKKIMQADEDVGKIAMTVPLLVSKALELFLQDLCDRTYEITLQKGAKTLNSLHLKQCVRSFNVFDFLREIVCKVPDLGGSNAAGEERSATKRRKIGDDDNHDVDDEPKRVRLQETLQIIEGGRGRGRGKGRGRGRGSGRGRGRPRRVDREATTSSEKHQLNAIHEDVDSKANHVVTPPAKTVDPTPAPVRNFDLNLDLDENGDTPLTPVTPTTLGMKSEEYPGWSMVIANLNSMVDDDEEEEDYDEEE